MNEETFRQIIQTYGTHEDHWPDAVRGSMRQWIQANPVAMSWMTQEQQLDQMLDRYRVPEPSPDFLTDVFSFVHQSDQLTLTRLMLPLAPKLGVLVISLIFGILLNIYAQNYAAELQENQFISESAFGFGFTDSEAGL